MADEVPTVTAIKNEAKTLELKEKLINNSEAIFKSGWRPACMWAFIFICFNDFVVLPYLALIKAGTLTGYAPLTLGGTGLFYLAFLTIGGVSAWQRGNEKNAIIEAVGGKP